MTAGHTAYSGEMTVAEARRRYFEDNGFGDDGGYSLRWVKVKLGPVELPLRNTKGRVRAVARHDLHHIATDYDTDLLGEAEIGAWEIAAGCGGFAAAWLLNLGAFSLGFWLSPRRVFRAFRRGRRSRTLYETSAEIDPGLLVGRVSALRQRLHVVPAPEETTPADVIGFALWSAAGFALGALSLALLLAPLALLAAAVLY